MPVCTHSDISTRYLTCYILGRLGRFCLSQLKTMRYSTYMEDVWQILDTYTSEVEARVVESYLRAQGVEVQLLDTHMNAYVPVPPTSGRSGMRLMVRTSQIPHAVELIALNQSTTRLEVVESDHVPMAVVKSPGERWMLFLVLAAATLTFLLTYFRPV